MVQPDRPQKPIWRMRIAYLIIKANNTHPQYVLLIVFHGNKGCTIAAQCYIIPHCLSVCLYCFVVTIFDYHYFVLPVLMLGLSNVFVSVALTRWNPKLKWKACNNSGLHSQGNHCFCNTKSNQSIPFREIIVFYSDKYTKHLTIPCIKIQCK
jgi:hypothetical protein